MDIENQYPIGKLVTEDFSVAAKDKALAALKHLPVALESALSNLDEAQLHTPYRDGGWTVHQLVHHIADSHMNAFLRFKLALTEDNPTIKPYDEDAWVRTMDVAQVPVNYSVTLLHALHARWTAAAQGLHESQWNRTVFHPQREKELSLWFLLQLYAWHGKHHVAQINFLREKMKW